MNAAWLRAWTVMFPNQSSQRNYSACLRTARAGRIETCQIYNSCSTISHKTFDNTTSTLELSLEALEEHEGRHSALRHGCGCYRHPVSRPERPGCVAGGSE